MNSPLKKFGAAAAVASAVLALGATAHAQTITAAGADHVGNDFLTASTPQGNLGYIIFATTPAGTAGTDASGNNVNSTTNGSVDPVSSVPVTNSNTVPPTVATTINTVSPTFAVIQSKGIGNGPNGALDFGNTYESYGNNFLTVTTGLEAGYAGTLAGPAAGQSANLFKITLGSGVPSSFTIGFLADYAPVLTGAAAALRPAPNTAYDLSNLTLINSLGAGDSQADPQSATNLQNDYLFSVTGATSGETLNFSGFGGKEGQSIVGITFTSAIASTPEPSGFLAMGLGVLGLSALAFKARRRTM